MNSSFRIAVVGAGAIGCYYGAKLAANGLDVHFLCRGDVEEIRQTGLRIIGRSDVLHLPRVQHAPTPEEIGLSDLVLVAVKATSNDDLVSLIPPLLRETTMLLTLQNGLGNEEFLATNFGEEHVLGGLCFICLNRLSRGTIEHYDYGHIVLGEYNRRSLERTHAIARAFRDAGVGCEVTGNLALERWRKLVWNIPFNGLSVSSGGKDTAAILSDDSLRKECLALMNEIIAAANRCGFHLSYDIALEQVERTKTMGPYKPSTLIDFEAGRPLEIEAIWGEPLRRAAAVGVAAPRLKELYETLKSMDASNRCVTANKQIASK